MNGQTQSEMDEIVREVTEEKLKYIRKNESLMRLIRGVATILGLNEGRLAWEVAKLGDDCLATEVCIRRDEELMVESIVERITDILADAGAWDEYHVERAPSAYRYAAAVALWLAMYKYYVGDRIPLSHPLFSDAVAAAIARFLATHVAYDIANALSSELKKVKHKYRPNNSL
jgi:hypothetical protein